MEEKIEEAEHMLQEKEAQLAKLQDQGTVLEASFVEAVGENKFKDFLLKVSDTSLGTLYVMCLCYVFVYVCMLVYVFV